MKIKMFQVDAFTDRVFGGNPAAVCIIEDWLDEILMQQIAGENNLSETAFAVKSDDHYEIRWFTPTSEVDLCGHATLAATHVLFQHYHVPGDQIRFRSMKMGDLAVRRKGEYLTLDFPADPVEQVKITQALIDAMGKAPVESYRGRTDYLLIYDTQADIEEISPNFSQLAEIDSRGVIVSAPGKETDVVSRFFAPGLGINEDPVTGSAHTTLTPYWSERLGKRELTARQLSSRKGELFCLLRGDRVHIRGKAVTYLAGEIEV